MSNHAQNYIDIMIHVSPPSAKPQLEAKLAACPGISKSQVQTAQPNSLFVSYDPEIFDIHSVPGIAHELGVEARIVDL